MARIALLSLVILFCVVCAPSFAQSSAAQRFTLPEHGQLQLFVPASWHVEVHQPAYPLPPTVVLQPNSGAPFQILITVVWPLRPGVPLPDTASLREEVASAAKSVASHSVEKVISLRELHGPASRGYYFAATDRAPSPGEFKYLTQGIVHLDDFNLAFTILTNDGQDAEVKEALELIRTASHATAKAA